MHLLVFQDSCVTLPWLLILHCFLQSLLLLNVDGEPKTGWPLREMKMKRPNLQTSPCLMTVMHYKHIGRLSECTWRMIWFYYCLWYMSAHSTIFILVLFINWVLTWCCFLRGGAAFQSLNASKVIKASIFCFLASVQGYSSSIVNFSSVLKQADLWPESVQSCHLSLR